MAHFAKINFENIVEKVEVVANDIATTEQAGVDFLNNFYNTNDNWKKTSYNTRGGVHLLGGTAFRKNYAGVGYTYDESKDAFIPPKPSATWILNEATCIWEPPVPYPNDGQRYQWNENTQNWQIAQDVN